MTAVQEPLAGSAQEVAALEALKEEIAKAPAGMPGREWLLAAGDVTYMRFLRGHKLDAKKAAKLLKQCAKWRESFGTNELLTTWPQDKSKEAILLRKSWAMGVTGKDYSGRPVHFFHLSMIDFPKLLKQVPLEMVVRYNVYLLERAQQDNPRGEAVMLVDLGSNDGQSAFSLRTVSKWLQSLLVFVKAMSKIADPFYPESYFRIYFCRLHTVLEKMFRGVSSTMAENTLAKVQIVNKNDLEKLKEDIPSECLPPSLGGTSTARIVEGGPIKDANVQEAAETAAALAAQAEADAAKAEEAAALAVKAPADAPAAPEAGSRISKRLSNLRKSISSRLSLSKAPAAPAEGET